MLRLKNLRLQSVDQPFFCRTLAGVASNRLRFAETRYLSTATCDCLAPTNAQRGDALVCRSFGSSALSRRYEDSGTTGTDGVSQRDRAAIDVDFFVRDILSST